MTLEGLPWAPFAQSSWASWVARLFSQNCWSIILMQMFYSLVFFFLFDLWMLFFFRHFSQQIQHRGIIFQPFHYDSVHNQMSQSSYWTQECAWLKCWVLLRRRLPGRSTFWWPSQCPLVRTESFFFNDMPVMFQGPALSWVNGSPSPLWQLGNQREHGVWAWIYLWSQGRLYTTLLQGQRWGYQCLNSFMPSGYRSRINWKVE